MKLRIPSFKSASILSIFIRGMTWTIPNKENAIFLTFDDGPHPEITPKVLAILKKYKVKATFFCIGKNVEKYPEIYQQIINEGHSVGNHTYSHHSGWRSNNKGYYADIEKAAADFIDSDLFRPPYGEVSPIQYNHLKVKYRIIMWDVLSKDYDQKLKPAQVLDNVTSGLQSGSIIVMHDSEKALPNMMVNLEPIITFALDQGFTFKAIPYNKHK
jgi:peptidoglycan-N-acetylglucosamine deacetylase